MFQKQTFGSTNTGFGGFGQQQATGTAVVKYNPVTGTDVVVKAGTSTNVNIKHHCITCMKEYDSKSLEELRLEDYVAKRNGPSGVFGTNSWGFPSLTGTAMWRYQSVLQSKDLVGHFGSVPLYVSLIIHCITCMKKYENKSLEELRLEDYVAGRKGPSGVFGTNTFGQPATTSTPSVFESSISSTPAFGQTTPGLFAATTTPAPAVGTNTSTFRLGANTQNQTGGLFNNKPANSGFGTTPSTGFGGFGAGLFTKTNTTAPTFGTTTPAFGSTGFGTSTTGSNLFGNNTFGKPPTSQPAFGFNTQPALAKSEQNELRQLNNVTEEKNHQESELHDREKERQQLKNEHEIDSGTIRKYVEHFKYKSDVSKVNKNVKFLTHQSTLELSERLGLQQGEEDILRDMLEEQGAGNENTAEDLQQGDEDALREQGAGNGDTGEDLQLKKNEKYEDTDITRLWEKKMKLAEEDAQKALERAERAKKKLEELQQRHSEDKKPNLISRINSSETSGEKKEIRIEPAPLQEPAPTSRPPSPPPPPPPPPPEHTAAMLADKGASFNKTKENARGAIDATDDQIKELKLQLKPTDQDIHEKPKDDQPVAVKNMIQIVVTLRDKKNIKNLATEQE